MTLIGAGHGMTPLTAAQPDAATARAYWTIGRNDRERLFRAARRHSRHVRLLRIAVPLCVAVVIAVYMLWKMLNPIGMLTANLPVGANDLVVSGSKITMEQPRLKGFTKDARSYELTASQASQDITKPDIVEMRDVRARFQMPDNGSAHVTALDGVFDSKNEVLKLGRNVVLDASSYKVWLNDAVVDVRTGDIVSEKPVEVKMLQGTLNAKRLEVKESGELLRFDGGVSMQLKLDNGSGIGRPQSAAPAAQSRPARER
jgi:lipopolysaccharide export system protein LptC